MKKTMSGLTNKRYYWLIDQVRKYDMTRIAEVGVARGNTTMRLLKHCPRLTVYAVDLWDNHETHSRYSREVYTTWNFDKEKQLFVDNVRKFKDRVIVLEGLSWEMTEHVHEPLDMVFIDADHGYETVKRDIEAWTPRLVNGGIISGHDINLSSVRCAVKEKIPTYRDARVDHVWWAYKEEVI